MEENNEEMREENNNPNHNPFFKKEDINNISQKEPKTYSKAELNRIKVFKYIEEHEPITIYKISKELEIAYTTVSYIVRDLIFSGVVSEQVKINENNQAYKELTIPKEGKNDS